MHSFWLEEIRKKLGASFVGWENSTVDGMRLKIRFGKEKTEYLELTGTQKNITADTYINLLKEL